MKSEDQALLSFGVCAASVLAIRRAHPFRLTRTRVFVGTMLFTAWQRFLASGMTTKTISSHFYVPAEWPEKEQHVGGLPLHRGFEHMVDKTCVVTGVSPGGIGFYTAAQLFRLGARVIVTTRETDPYKMHDLAVEVVKAADVHEAYVGATTRIDRVQVVTLDLGGDIPDAVRSCVAQLDELGVDCVDVLVNNAGAMYQLGDGHSPRFHAGMGLEKHFAVNTVAPILLTEALKPRIPVGGRVVHVASDAHRQVAALDTAKQLLQGRAVSRSFLQYYGASKLGNIVYAATQNRRDKHHVHVAVHPGVAVTNIYRDQSSLQFFKQYGLLAWIEGLTLLALKSPKEASHTSVHCAVDPFVPRAVAERGEFYFVDCAPGNKYLSKIARTEAAQDECMSTINELIDAALERKKKDDLRKRPT